jgi:hypothetical protein
VTFQEIIDILDAPDGLAVLRQRHDEEVRAENPTVTDVELEQQFSVFCWQLAIPLDDKPSGWVKTPAGPITPIC